MKKLIKTYSDEGKYIVQNETGNKYDCAVDVYPIRYRRGYRSRGRYRGN